VSLTGVGRLGAVAAVLGLSASLVGGAASSAAEAPCSGYRSWSATAAADGVRALVGPAGLAPFEFADGEGPSAAAHADSLGNQSAVAAGVYSDAAVSNLPFVTGVDFSQVPVLVMASYPAQPTAARDLPGLVLRASSDGAGSSASAQLGPPTGEQAGVARLDTSASAGCASDGKVAAEAALHVEGISVAGVVHVAGLRSSATASTGSDGSPRLGSQLVVEGLSVAGQQVAVTDAGLVAGPARAVLPGTGPASPVLEAGGVTLRYLTPVTDADGRGRLAPGLAITVKRRIEGVGTGPASLTVVLGRAYARVESAEAPGADRSDGNTGRATVDTGATTLGERTPDQAAGLSGDFAAEGPQSSPSAAAERRLAPQVPGGGVPDSGADFVGSSATAGQAGSASLVGRSVASVYPAIGVGAVALVLAALAFRAAGVRVRWR
jgi:hypothetical protein